MCEQLSPCSYFPIGASSRDDVAAWNRVEPFAVSGDPVAAFARLKNLLAGTARTVIVTATDHYLHAVCRTRLGFADDLEFRLCPADRVIHVRSASRSWIAFYDYGVNRARVEALRRQL